MNHHSNHSNALKASQNVYQGLYQIENIVEPSLPNGCIDAHPADTRVEIQMANTVVMMQMGPANEQIASVADHVDLADRRVEIQGDDKLKLTLQEWESSLKRALHAVQFIRAWCINGKNELYQLAGFYTIFQGVVLTAVVQNSLLQCQTSWGPASISLLVSIATIPAVHNRLKEYHVHKNKLFWEIEKRNVINEKIKMLKRKGACFNIAEHERVEEKIHTPEKERQFRAQSRKNNIVNWLTTLFLSVFSSVMLSCCYVIPCWKSLTK